MSNSDCTEADADRGGPVMLALSTFRRSDKAIDLAMERAGECGRLLILLVADVNLARYLIGADLGLYPEIRRQCEDELLEEHERQGREHVEAIAERAREQGLEVSTHVSVGRFALLCLEVVERESPCLIVTTRSRRPAWVRRFFGSPVDHLIAHAPCPVIEA
jgi:nucleotide-binding universal stress UspA family protein